MRMIYVGSLATSPDRDSNWINAFRDEGCEVIPFCSSVEHGRNVIGKINCRLHVGRKNRKMQHDLLVLVKQQKPDWVHFRLPLEFERKTINKIKSLQITVTQYMNDDPFSKKSPLGLYWKFHRALTAYHAHFVYRPHNIESYLKSGAHIVEHCPPTYDPARHTDESCSEGNGFIADAAFIGHYENDWRAACLEHLAQKGFRVIVRGGGWDNVIHEPLKSQVYPVRHAFGKEYNQIYANVVAGICFFSKINNDFWTERGLEIVAVGGLLVCERTDEAASYFKDREEAYFFSSMGELAEIIEELKTNPAKREAVRRAGYARLMLGKNTINDRARQVLQKVMDIRTK